MVSPIHVVQYQCRVTLSHVLTSMFSWKLQLGLDPSQFALFHDRVHERPDSMPDPDPTIIAMSKDDGRLAHEPDAGGCARENDRTRLERGGLGEESDGVTDAEDLVSVQGSV